jgi:predicted O-linked N-acetylglucosamine transferase (SPINDLY family)
MLYMNEQIDWITVRKIALNGDCVTAITLYEQKIEGASIEPLDYWRLGLLHLFAGDASMTEEIWLGAILETQSSSDCTEADIYTFLDAEAIAQEDLQHLEFSCTIRESIYELFPSQINNTLKIIDLCAQQRQLDESLVENLDIIAQLQSIQQDSRQAEIDSDILVQTIANYIEAAPSEAQLLDFLDAAIAAYPNYLDWLLVVLPAVLRIANLHKRPKVAAKISEIYLKHDPDNIEFLGHISLFYQNSGQHQTSLERAEKRYQLTVAQDDIPEAIFSSHLMLRAHMTPGGQWKDIARVAENHKKVLTLLTEEHASSSRILKLLTSAYFLPYLKDDIVGNRAAQNRLGKLCQLQIEHSQEERVDRYRENCKKLKKKTHGKIRIGYISHCLTNHSVGWLTRWLIQYHDRSQFEIYGYFLNYKGGHLLQEWFVEQMDVAYKTILDHPHKILAVADQINQDEIQILIDLDSITIDVIGEILAMKPAPIQVTWLGWDASGLPAIDYFIADSHVLPENAEQLYSETIYRLPGPYIAVDGFEIGTPTLRRDDLNIPIDAVVYMTIQSSYKYNIESSNLYLAILSGVPNSYLLIKMLGEESPLKQFFFRLAEENGINPNRFIFIAEALSEMEHRANLGIADIVLDTFPYNGATTTMETLWVGVPMVTKVGTQFAARNSYTMMMYAGITEGIAWSDEEYISWGIKLGSDRELRESVICKLKQSRHTSPLWNGKKFAKTMENTYQHMWESYVTTSTEAIA